MRQFKYKSHVRKFLIFEVQSKIFSNNQIAEFFKGQYLKKIYFDLGPYIYDTHKK